MLKFKSITVLTIVLAVVWIVISMVWEVSFAWVLLVLLLWLVITIMGSFFIGWNYHLNALNHNKNCNQPYVSITFDDGPNPEFTPKVLQLLKDYNAKATFFVIGKNAENHSELLRQILKEGHSIGNHTYSHKNDFGFYNTESVVSELERTNTVVERITGKQMQLYRPAFGVTNPSIKKAVKNLQLTTVGWNQRSLDTTGISSEKIFNRVTKTLQAGDVILFHDTNPKTVEVLERLLLFLQNKKLQSVSVDRLFNIPAYA